MFKSIKNSLGDEAVIFQDSEGRDCRIDFFGSEGVQMDIGDGYAVFDAEEAIKLAEILIEKLR